MTRRSTPERLHAARREATLRRLIGEGESPECAEIWIGEWEVEAARQSLERDGRYWEAGWTWITERRTPAAADD
jgi:hypothetical protein